MNLCGNFVGSKSDSTQNSSRSDDLLLSTRRAFCKNLNLAFDSQRRENIKPGQKAKSMEL